MGRKNKLFNPVIVLFVTLLTVIGTLIGILCSGKNTEAQEIIKETEFFSGNFAEVFKQAFFNKLTWTLAFATGGFNIYFIPLALAGIVLKSYSYGFTTGCIVAVMGTYGYFTVLSGLFIQNFLFTAVSVFYTSYAVNKSFECFLNRRNYECVSGKNRSFLFITVIMLVSVFIISAIEGGISFLLYDI